ncbi:MAG: energy transducer TonB [Gammaproteobacteria bacterium]|nr:MAG: energy transducer TonB [Gammaproteobacteria bacterium]PIE37850.1 MAG: energy transducer TonB [Gammaproteobacteria bacterium]
MSIDTPKPDVLTLSLFGAAVAHALFILGVSFDPLLDDIRTPPSLEVVLVPNNSDSMAPEEADYLAQHSQDGGGESDEASRPASPFASNQDFDTDGVAPQPVRASAPAPVEQRDRDAITAVFADEELASDDQQEQNEHIEAHRDKDLIEQDLEIAKLAAEIDRQREAFAKRPKKKHINARTTEAAYADYMYRWVEKVENIGNLNYPDAARRRNLTGALILIVGIHKTGEIESITVDESSGHKILDDAAKRIVELAAPFEVMTGKLAEETDILYIVRTWEFQSGNSITSY